jgi:hypothetical protein
MPARLAAAVAFLTTATLLGCASGENSYDVSGTVTYDGKPVPKGLIFFDPDGPGKQGYATIQDGRYNTAETGKGIGGGKYAVRINGFDGKAGPDAALGQGLFPEHIERKDLPAAPSVCDIAVPVKKK